MEKRFLTDDNLSGAIDLALDQAKESGEFDGAPGKDGNPGVYIGSGDMPEGYNVQIDPNGDAFTVDDLIPEKPTPMVGATETEAGTAGLVPAPAAGDGGKFLRGDGTWGEIAIPEGGGGGMQLLIDYTAEEEVLNDTIRYLDFLTDKDGNALSAKNVLVRIVGTVVNATDSDSQIRINFGGDFVGCYALPVNSPIVIYAIASVGSGVVGVQFPDYAANGTIKTKTITHVGDTIMKIGIGGNNYFKTHLAAGSNIKVWGW